MSKDFYRSTGLPVNFGNVEREDFEAYGPPSFREILEVSPIASGVELCDSRMTDVRRPIRCVMLNLSLIHIFSCIRALPERRSYIAYGENGSRRETGDFYRRVVPYLESINGGDIAKQAVRIKQLFEDFDADYLVLDLRNAGIGVYDLLIKVLYDEERQKEYPPWGCMKMCIRDRSAWSNFETSHDNRWLFAREIA